MIKDDDLLAVREAMERTLLSCEIVKRKVAAV